MAGYELRIALTEISAPLYFIGTGIWLLAIAVLFKRFR